MKEHIEKSEAVERACGVLTGRLTSCDDYQPELVRCKDCKNWYNACCGLGTGNCSALERLTFETFSCAYGERR